MKLRATMGGVKLEIWFTPSFNIKTTDKRIETLLRTMELEVFDPVEMRTRKIKATKGIREAFIILEEISEKIPQLKVTFEEVPELENHEDQGTEENPVTH